MYTGGMRLEIPNHTERFEIATAVQAPGTEIDLEGAEVVFEHQPARDITRSAVALREGLAKLGGTLFEVASPEDDISLGGCERHFLPASVLNGLRRDAVAALEDRKSTRLNSSHSQQSRMPSSA